MNDLRKSYPVLDKVGCQPSEGDDLGKGNSVLDKVRREAFNSEESRVGCGLPGYRLLNRWAMILSYIGCTIYCGVVVNLKSNLHS